MCQRDNPILAFQSCSSSFAYACATSTDPSQYDSVQDLAAIKRRYSKHFISNNKGKWNSMLNNNNFCLTSSLFDCLNSICYQYFLHHCIVVWYTLQLIGWTVVIIQYITSCRSERYPNNNFWLHTGCASAASNIGCTMSVLLLVRNVVVFVFA